MPDYEDVEAAVFNESIDQDMLYVTLPPQRASDSLARNRLDDDEVIRRGLRRAEKRQERAITQLEQELDKEHEREFDAKTMVILRGKRQLRYLMRARQIVLGRRAKNEDVDVDLSGEGDASRVSRKHVRPLAALPAPLSRCILDHRWSSS